MEDEISDVQNTLKVLFELGDSIAQMLTESRYYAPYTVSACKWYVDDIVIDDSDGSCTMKFIAHEDYQYSRYVDLDRMLDPEYVQVELQIVREKTDQYRAKMDESRRLKAESVTADTERRERLELERLQSKYGTRS